MPPSSRKISNIIVATTFLAIIATSAWYALKQIELQTRARSKNALQTVLLTTQEALHIWISQRKLGTAELARNETLVNLTQTLLTDMMNKRNTTKTVAAIRDVLDPRLALNGDRGFYILSARGDNIASMHDAEIGKINQISLQRKEYITDAFKGASTFIPAIKIDEPSIYTAAPVKNIAGNVIAVLVIQINPKRQFTRITQLGRIGESGETYAFDEHGTLISESRFDAQLRSIGLIDPDSRGILSIRITDPGGNLLSGYTPTTTSSEQPLTRMAKDAIAGHAGYDISGYRDYRGVEVFGAWLWDKALGFGLTTEIDANEALQPFYETRKAIIIMILLSLFLASTFVFISRRKLD